MKRKRLDFIFVLCVLCFLNLKAVAQLSSNPDKFLGNITTRYNVDYGNEKFYTLWNQITCENESKWGSIEGSRRGSFNWGGTDAAYNYAKQYGFPFKFHTLIWGAQYPNWMNSLSTSEQYDAIVEWMDAVKARYPDLEMIDVVNEAVPGHAPAPYKNALGGDGKTGYDWIIKAFELAYERWPDAILIYNDYNTFRWQKSEFIELVRILRDAGAPVDAYGCQAHDLTDMNFSDFKAAMTEIQNVLKMPMYSTEYDIGTSDDAHQLQQYKDQIPYMWEADYFAGITLWGYIYGATWTTDGNSGIIRDGVDRPAMAWLREYMKTDAAKNAKSPFPGMKKEASVYVKPASITVTKNDTVPITIRARLSTKSIDSIMFYVNNTLHAVLTEAPYTTEYVPTKLGKHELKAVVYADDGSTYERLSGINVYNPRVPFKEHWLPGTVQAEDFDISGEGLTYHDTDNRNEGGTNYRTDAGGVDIVTGNGGYALGYTKNGEWLEYTVNVSETGLYSYDAYVSSGVTNSSFSLSLVTDDGLVSLTDIIAVPQTGSNTWETYKAVSGRMLLPLNEGKNIIRLNITGSNCNIDKFVFKRVEIDKNLNIRIKADPSPATVYTNSILSFTPTKPAGEEAVTTVKVYMGGVLYKTLTEKPFEFTYRPTVKGTVNFSAIASDASGKESDIAKYSLVVNNRRTPYSGSRISIPGTIEAENFDKGGEGFTYHDSDSENEGNAEYRTDSEGVDIGTGNNGTVIGYTVTGEWLEYSIDVKEPGKYSYEATVSSGTSGSGFSISVIKDGKTTNLCTVNVTNTGSWGTYIVQKGNFSAELEEGPQILRITITGSYCNIDKIKLICTLNTAVEGISSDEYRYYDMFDVNGNRVDESYKGIIIMNGKKILNR